MIYIEDASATYLENWDVLIDSSINGTIFHRLAFLAYHGDKFKFKERHLSVLNGDSVMAQISLVIEDIEGSRVARSPYGGSYGGFIFQRSPSYREGKEIADAIIGYLRENGVSRFSIIHPIACCAPYLLDTFYFSLMVRGFRSVNRDISSVVCFQQGVNIEKMVSPRARRMARKAEAAGIHIERNADLIDFWKVMEATFEKHGTKPTHTLEEFKALMSLLPERVYIDVAYKGQLPVAGIAFFVINSRVKNSFYLCQDPASQMEQGLSLLALRALQRCQEEGYLFFDFGPSSHNMVARDNIFSFKENFSKVGMFRETFEWTRE